MGLTPKAVERRIMAIVPARDSVAMGTLKRELDPDGVTGDQVVEAIDRLIEQKRVRFTSTFLIQRI